MSKPGSRVGMDTTDKRRPWAIALAFLAVYLLWGSTYLAMRIGVRTLPPFVLGALRFFIAGALLWGHYAWRGRTGLARGHWRNTSVTGVLLLVGGNGGVVWSVQHIPSGLAALIVGTVPLWVVVIEWRRGVRRPTMQVVLGLLAGLVGMAILLGPALLPLLGAQAGHDHHFTWGVLVVLAASVSWSFGSLRARSTQIPGAPLLPTAMQMLSGGAALLVLAATTGELQSLRWQALSAAAIGAVAYLVVCGSLVAYTCYIWLLQTVPPARVATYAFVNPLVAVFLGWALADEPVTARTLAATAVILAGVALITLAPRSAARP